jgi:NADH dehydrogenase
MTVALTGGTGFVGRHVLAQLVSEGHRVRVLVRDQGRLQNAGSGVTPVKGDLFQPNALKELVTGADAVIHIVGIIMEKPRQGQTFERVHTEGTKNVLAAAKKVGVKRWVQMSALGSRPDAPSRYHTSKWHAEQAVKESGIPYTIFRPSIIHGPDGEFMQMVRDFWCKAFPPFVPFFCRGTDVLDIIQIKMAMAWPFPSLKRYSAPRYVSEAPAGRLQPVLVDDVARCFVGALTRPQTIGEVYPLGGPDAMTWQQLYITVRSHLPKARAKKVCAVPAWYAKMIAGLPGVPFNRDQVLMSQEDSTCDIGKVQEDFGVELASFDASLAEYAPKLA